MLIIFKYSGKTHRFDLTRAKNDRGRGMMRRPTSAPIPPTTKRKRIRVMRKRPIISINGDESELQEEERTSSILRGVSDDEHSLKIHKNIITEAPR